MQGPFSAGLNEALIRQLDIRFLVSKDGGKQGGFPEKVMAAEKTGIRMIVIGRNSEEGLDPEQTLEVCREFMYNKE